MANRPRYQTIEVLDVDGVPRYIGVQRAGESFLRMAWECREIVDNRLMFWLRLLSVPPKSRVLLGRGVQLAAREAWALARFQRERVSRMAGSWPDPPDFAVWPALSRGGRDHPRPVCRVRDGVVERFVSVEQAAGSARTSRDAVEERIESGHPDEGGWSWWEWESADN
jgi:hypothetical protein